MKLLLVEDDVDLGNGVRIALSERGMGVVWVRCRVDAERVLDQQGCDLVLLDLALPDGDGMDLLRRVRQEPGGIPVLILTARDTLADRIRGLDTGADDYLVKPFALEELASRVRALVRRSYGYDGETLAARGVVLHLPTRRVTLRGEPANLSKTEFGLLTALLKRPGRVQTRRALEQHILPSDGEYESNVLDAHMSNLRRKLGGDLVRTVRGVGYVIDADEV